MYVATKSKVAVLTYVIASLCATGAMAAQFQCKGNPKVVETCSTVHGRLGIYNGIPVRIWVIGSNHMLGAVDMNPAPNDIIDAAPENVRKFCWRGSRAKSWCLAITRCVRWKSFDPVECKRSALR